MTDCYWEKKDWRACAAEVSLSSEIEAPMRGVCGCVLWLLSHGWLSVVDEDVEMETQNEQSVGHGGLTVRIGRWRRSKRAGRPTRTTNAPTRRTFDQ
jgi:hypothetical protein